MPGAAPFFVEMELRSFDTRRHWSSSSPDSCYRFSTDWRRCNPQIESHHLRLNFVHSLTLSHESAHELGR